MSRLYSDLAHRIAAYVEGVLQPESPLSPVAIFPVLSTNHGMLDVEVRLVPHRKKLITFELVAGELTATCELCDATADPVTMPSWHGQHIRECHPECVTSIEPEDIPQ